METFLAPFTSIDGLISLFTLVLLELILGIDNIIFIAIICGYVPGKKDQRRARIVGLTLALVVRIILLGTINFIIGMRYPLEFLDFLPFPVTGRGLILFAGGVFLIIKTITEIYHKFKIADKHESAKSRQITLRQAIIQITFIDIVFSFDSILTAVGVTADHPNQAEALAIMVIAVVIAMIGMLLFAPYVSGFIEKYPTLKMLALTFLVVIGIILVAEALEDSQLLHLPEGVNIKTYAYIALFFSSIVEMLNIRFRNVKARRGGDSQNFGHREH
ncbi:MAG: TerC family protein [Flavobacteriales bacterium]|nr:TerC family protein [Flavobacteriales bacterium]